MDYNSANNQLTDIGGPPPQGVAVTYDAAGNQLNDQFEDYQYDAEGRVKSSTCISGCGWQDPTYNALGQRVQDYQSDYLGGAMTLTYPRDIFGHRIGTWDQRPSANWTGWDVYWSRVAGQRLNMGGSSGNLDHSDAVGSTTMETDPSGAVLWDITRYPWGQIWQQTGTRPSGVFAGLDWEVNDPLIPSATREYNNGIGRWMTPDPGGRKVVKLDNPQTWNMYAYALDNPTTFNDPSGLCSVGGEPHIWVWCAVHRLLGQTQKQKHTTVVRAMKPPVITVTATATAIGLGPLGYLAYRHRQQLEQARASLLNWEGQHPNITALIGFVAAIGIGGEEDVAPEGEEVGPEGENPVQFKRLSNGEIEKLKENGIDPEELKPNARYDLFKDKRGNIYVMPKSGGGPGDPTGFNINDY